MSCIRKWGSTNLTFCWLSMSNTKFSAIVGVICKAGENFLILV